MTKASGSRSPAVNQVLRGEVQFYPLSTNTQVWSKEMGRRLPTYRYGRDTCNLLQTMMAWQNGYAADCNPAHPCSTQGVISKYGSLVQAEQSGSKPGRCGCKSYMVRQYTLTCLSERKEPPCKRKGKPHRRFESYGQLHIVIVRQPSCQRVFTLTSAFLGEIKWQVLTVTSDSIPHRSKP